MNALILAVLLSVPAATAVDIPKPPTSLRTPTIVFAAAAAADWASTYDMLRDKRGIELNQLYASTKSHPLKTVALGVALDVAGVWAWNRYVGKKHPKLAKVGLYVAAAARMWLAVRNTSLDTRGGRWAGHAPPAASASGPFRY